MTNKLGSSNPNRIPTPKKNRIVKCPQCKSKNVIPIVYGHISLENYKKNEDKFTSKHLGGCIVERENTYCDDCNHKFVKEL